MDESSDDERLPRRSVLVVGAGAAGLSAAGALAGRHDVVVIDKGRGLGGRMATRRIGEATFDHGAQFFTTHTERFAEVVAGWEATGVAEPWFRSRVGPAGVAADDGHTRFRGVSTMTAIARHLGRGLDVRCSVRATALEVVDDGWILRTHADGDLHADAMVLTAPVSQTLALLGAGGVPLAPTDQEALAAIGYDPCLTALVPLAGPGGLPEPGAVAPDDGPIDWMADNQAKGISAAPGVTIHATAAFSVARLDAPDELVIGELLAAAALGVDPLPDVAQVHRWRYAKPTVLHPERCLAAAGLPPLVVAGDAFGGAKVEGAVLSGLAAATATATALEHCCG
jgi:predicted NAD/FAD-dependent oxidoreductase